MYDCMRQYEYILRASGLWPNTYAEFKKQILYNAYTGFCFVYFIFGLILRLLLPYYSQFDIELFTKGCLEGAMTILLFLQYALILFSRKKLMSIIIKMRSKFYHQDGYAKEITDKCITNEGLILKIFFIITLLGPMSEIIQTLFLPSSPNEYRFNSYWNKTNPEYRLPFALPLPFDDTVSPYYEIAGVLNLIAIYLGMVTLIFSYTLTPILITHICGQFKILTEKLENLNSVISSTQNTILNNDHEILSENKNSLSVEINFKDTDEIVKNVIKMHQEFLIISDEVITFLQPFTMIKTFFSIGLLSIGLFATLLTGFGSPLFFVAGGFLVGIFLELLLLSISSENLASHSLSVYDAVYNCNWYNYPEHVKKNLKLTMLRAQKPLKLNVRTNFAEIDLKKFVQVLQACYSAYTVLRKTVGKIN